MKNNFLKNFIIIGGGTFISMFIGFITTPIITRAVDPNAYGEYSIFTLYSSIAVMVLYLGILVLRNNKNMSAVYFTQKELVDQEVF